jgi:hydroxypyruvate isomerase
VKTPILSRRNFLRNTTATALGVAAAALHQRLDAADAASGTKGRIHHSVCKWCYPKVSLEEICAAGKGMGLASVELLQPSDYPTLKKHDLICAMTSNPTVKGPDGKDLGGITRAFNRKEHHDLLVPAYESHIGAVADAGFKNLICFSGNREGLDDETGLKNCAEGIQRLIALCEKKGVILCMELLNSRVNHPDYMCDHSVWGLELCKRISSANFRLLYDIYHMQIMEGDVIATIRKHHEYFAHYHTGGVPGRHEIDDTQELNYAAIMRAIVETGHTGHVAQEFIPARPDVLASLGQAVKICDV